MKDLSLVLAGLLLAGAIAPVAAAASPSRYSDGALAEEEEDASDMPFGSAQRHRIAAHRRQTHGHGRDLRKDSSGEDVRKLTKTGKKDMGDVRDEESGDEDEEEEECTCEEDDSEEEEEDEEMNAAEKAIAKEFAKQLKKMKKAKMHKQNKSRRALLEEKTEWEEGYPGTVHEEAVSDEAYDETDQPEDGRLLKKHKKKKKHKGQGEGGGSGKADKGQEQQSSSPTVTKSPSNGPALKPTHGGKSGKEDNKAGSGKSGKSEETNAPSSSIMPSHAPSTSANPTTSMQPSEMGGKSGKEGSSKSEKEDDGGKSGKEGKSSKDGSAKSGKSEETNAPSTSGMPSNAPSTSTKPSTSLQPSEMGGKSEKQSTKSEKEDDSGKSGKEGKSSKDGSAKSGKSEETNAPSTSGMPSNAPSTSSKPSTSLQPSEMGGKSGKHSSKSEKESSSKSEKKLTKTGKSKAGKSCVCPSKGPTRSPGAGSPTMNPSPGPTPMPTKTATPPPTANPAPSPVTPFPTDPTTNRPTETFFPPTATFADSFEQEGFPGGRWSVSTSFPGDGGSRRLGGHDGDENVNWARNTEEAATGIYSITTPDLSNDGFETRSANVTIDTSDWEAGTLAFSMLSYNNIFYESLTSYVDDASARTYTDTGGQWRRGLQIELGMDAQKVTWEYTYNPYGSDEIDSGAMLGPAYLDDVFFVRGSPGPGPTPIPTYIPTVWSYMPTFATFEPTFMPAGAPGGPPPTPKPTKLPTNEPTKGQTPPPTPPPTDQPTKAPTKAPTKVPTKAPTKAPTNEPTKEPTNKPTASPSEAQSPTKAPTESTDPPTREPTDPPTPAPSPPPTTSPPTKAPIATTDQPTKSPTSEPTLSPVGSPPTSPPTKAPTGTTGQPTTSPTKAPQSTPTPPPQTPPPTVGQTPPPTVGQTPPPTVGQTPPPTVAQTPPPTSSPTGTPAPTPKQTVPVLSLTSRAVTIGFEDDDDLDLFVNDGWQVVTEGGFFSDNAVRPLPNDGSGGIAELSLTMDTIRGAYFFLQLNSFMDPANGEKLEIFLDGTLQFSLPATTGQYIPFRTELPPGRSTILLRYQYGNSGNGDVLVDNIGINPRFSDDFESGDFFALEWVVDDGWVVDETDPYEGSFSARLISDSVGLGESRVLRLAVNPFAGGSFTFRTKPNVTAACDNFIVYLDDRDVASFFAPETEYVQRGGGVPPFQHNITFVYTKTRVQPPPSVCTTGTVLLDAFSFNPNEGRPRPPSSQLALNSAELENFEEFEQYYVEAPPRRGRRNPYISGRD